MTVKMEKPLILICLLIGQACSGTNLEVCSSFKPEEVTHIELKHTRQVAPGTVCQCTAKSIWSEDCLKISYYPSSQKNQELPGVVAVNRSKDMIVDREFCVIDLVFQVDKLSGNILNITDHEPLPVMEIVIVCSVFIVVVVFVIVIHCLRRNRLRRGSCISLMKIRHQRNGAPICEQNNGNDTNQRFPNDSNAYTYIETTEFKKVDVPVKEKPFVTVVAYDHLGTGNGQQSCCDDGPVKTYQTGNAYDHAFFVREASKANVTSAYDRTNFRQNGYDRVIIENEGETRVEDVMNETYSHPSQNLDSNYQQIGRGGSDREECCNNTYDRVHGTE